MQDFEQLKVLQIYKDFYPPVKGGIEKHINLLSTSLKKKGLDVEVLVSNTRPRLEIEFMDDIRIIKAPAVSRIASAPLNMSLPFLLRKASENADILHFHLPNPTAVIAFLFSGIRKPLVATYHSDIVRQKTLKKIYSPFSRMFLEKTDAIIATSPNYVNTSDELRHYREKCHVVPLGIRLSDDNGRGGRWYDAATLKNKFGPRIVLFVGRFRYYKGLKYLIEAMKGVNATLLLVGSGPLEMDLKSYVNANEMRGKVIFMGEVSDQDIGAFYEACDVVVLPSVYKSEAFGMILLEAMLHGKPVISTELGTGTSFVNLNNQTGFVVPPRNVHELSRAIQSLLDNADLCRFYGQFGKARVGKCFEIHQMAEKIISIYGEVQTGCRLG